MKRVLIITYYWPPSGGAGVQRWLKFAKYLRAYGWEPVIYTPENPEMPVEDTSLLKDVPQGITVLKTKIREPYGFYKMFVGRKKEEKINTGFLTEKKRPGLAEKISVWIRGNFFIPDARRSWIKPSVRFLSGYLAQNKIDAVVSTGPPHSMHLIALGLKKRLGIKWIADFRDPWTNIDYYRDLKLSRSSDEKHKRLEKEVLLRADKVICVGDTMCREFEAIAGKKFEVITNGYDEEDVYKGKAELDKKFSLVHIGTLVRSRNPEILWKALSGLVSERKEFAEALEIKFVGKADVVVSESLEESGLERFVTKIDYLPHAEVVKFQQQSQVLLLLINNTVNAKGILTGKFFEYLSARRPVLCIGPEDGDMAKIIAETRSGKISGFNDEAKLRENILGYFERYRTGALTCESTGIEKYSRKELTGRLAEALHSL